MYLSYMFYALAVLWGGSWSLYLVLNAENAGDMQASISPVVIGYLIAEGVYKAVQRLTDMDKRDSN